MIFPLVQNSVLLGRTCFYARFLNSSIKFFCNCKLYALLCKHSFRPGWLMNNIDNAKTFDLIKNDKTIELYLLKNDMI